MALSADWPTDHAQVRPVALSTVSLGGFLGGWVARNNGPSLLAGLDSPVFRSYEADARGGGWRGDYRRRGAADSDLYKWLEAACYALASGYEELRASIERVVEVILAAQAPAGFVHTNRSRHEGLDPRARNELYIAGHLFEAAVAHHRATGEDALLDAARRWAEYLHAGFAAGHPYFDDVPANEHPEAELALVRLARATGEARYLDFAAALAGRATVSEHVADLRCGPHDRHAVCTLYLLSAWAELFLETGDERWRAPLEPLLGELERTRLYVHGGLGLEEIIPANPWHLPQAGSVAETCAAVALMQFARRMHAITGASDCFDLIERVLMNVFLGSLSADGLAILYFSPLRQLHPGDEGRQDLPGARTRLPALHRTSCCFPNAWRMLAALPEYVFASTPDGLQVNLLADAACRAEVAGVPVRLRMHTAYPADGRVEIAVDPERAVRFRLELRVPGWCERARVTIAGGVPTSVPGGGYYVLDRTWAAGDTVTLELPLAPVALASRPEITANTGQVALMRGPVLYCLEKQDAGGLPLERLAITPEVEEAPLPAGLEVAGGLPGLVLEARELSWPADGPAYAPSSIRGLGRSQAVTLVPWLARANRESRRWRALLPVAQ